MSDAKKINIKNLDGEILYPITISEQVIVDMETPQLLDDWITVQTTQLSATNLKATTNETNITALNTQINATNSSVGQLANENLLINADFSINQREETSYSGENVYSVDRWKLCSSYSFATQNTDTELWSFGLTGVGTSSSNSVISQAVEKYSVLAGTTVTASFKFSDLTESVSGSTYLSIYDGVGSTQVALNTATNNIVSVSHTISSSATCLMFMIVTVNGTDCSITPVYSKLEVGSLATMYVPRQPSDDLLLCQRYYQMVNIYGVGSYTTNLVVGISLPNSLRTTPTLTVIENPMVYGLSESYYVKSVTVSASSLVTKYNTLGLTIVFNTVDDDGDDYGYVTPTRHNLYLAKSGTISLDAEIY